MKPEISKINSKINLHVNVEGFLQSRSHMNQVLIQKDLKWVRLGLHEDIS